MANEKSYTVVEIPTDNTYEADEHGYAQQILQFNTDSNEKCIIEYLHEENENDKVEEAHKTNTDFEYFENDEEQDHVIKRRWWTRDQTLALIKSVATHYHQLKDPGKKKHVWTIVSADLKHNNVSITSKECSIKWRNLMRSYIKIKGDKKKQNCWSLKFEFFDEMDEVITMNAHSIYAHSISSMKKPETGSAGCSASDIPSVQVSSAGISSTKPVGGKQHADQRYTAVRQSRKLISKKFQRLRSKRHLARMREQWRRRQEEWEQRHQEKHDKMLLYKQRLELRTKKLELLEKYLDMREKQKYQ